MRWLPKAWARVISQVPGRDVALTFGLLTLGLVEATWVSGAERPLALVLVAPLTIPLLWRRQRPLAVALVITGAIVVQLASESLRIFDQTFVGFVCVLLSMYAVGRHAPPTHGRWAAAVLAGCALALAGALGWHDRSGASFVLALVFVLAPAATGRVVAVRADLRGLLERQGVALRQSADVAERTRVAEVRGRIAGEVQDLVSHRVHEMVARSEAARRLTQRDSAQAAALVATVEMDGRAALEEMRAMLGVLRSADLWGSTSLQPADGSLDEGEHARRTPLWQGELPIGRVELLLLGALFVLVAAETLLTAGALPTVSLTVSAPLLAFAVGARLGGRASVVVLGLVLVAVAAVNVLLVEAHWGDYVFPSVLVVLSWVGGRLVRGQNELVQRSRRGAAALERSAEVRAAAAATEERLRLARDLHDVLAHTLMVMVVQSGAARRSMESGRPGAEEALMVVEETGRAASSELRRLLHLVDPHSDSMGQEPGATPGLPDLQSLVVRARATGLAAELVVGGRPVSIPDGVALAAFRIAQEAVTNVIRHAEATAVHLTLHFAPGLLRLEVRDDGRAGPDVTGSSSGNGIIGMGERAAIYDGRVLAGPSPGGGYLVTATFPLAQSLQGQPA